MTGWMMPCRRSAAPWSWDLTSAEARAYLALALIRTGSAPEAIKVYREALQLRPDWLEAMNNLAWALATCPDSTVRDGTEAVKLTERLRAHRIPGNNVSRHAFRRLRRG